jgi:signal transduction histidine kinase
VRTCASRFPTMKSVVPTHKGSGLIGLVDRVEALGGQLRISSLVGSGTSLLATIPFDGS